MDPDTLQATIEATVRRAVAPLEAELARLRAEVEALRDGPSSSAAPPAEPPTALEAALEPTPTTAAERNDFARMLQRGLEQEAKLYAEEPKPKDAGTDKGRRGWNPFKR